MSSREWRVIPFCVLLIEAVILTAGEGVRPEHCAASFVQINSQTMRVRAQAGTKLNGPVIGEVKKLRNDGTMNIGNNSAVIDAAAAMAISPQDKLQALPNLHKAEASRTRNVSGVELQAKSIAVNSPSLNAQTTMLEAQMRGDRATHLDHPATSKSDGTREHSGLLGNPTLTAPNYFQPVEWFTWLRSISMFAILKAACMGSNVVFQISPYPQVRQIRKEQSTGQSDGAPFVSIAFSCCQWFFYGTFAWLVTGKDGFLVIVYANSLGMVLGVFYVWIFHANCKDEAKRDMQILYYRVIASLVLAQIVMIALLPSERALFYSGLVASACTLMSACSPLTSVPVVLKTKSSQGMPMLLILALFVSSLLWFACGVILADNCLIYPNFVGCCTSFFLLGLTWQYPQDNVHATKAEKTLPQKLGQSEETVSLLCSTGSTGDTLD